LHFYNKISIKRSDFLISLETVANLFSYTITLSIQLQSPKQDLSGAFSYVEKIICLFEEKKRNSEIEFSNYFKNACQTATFSWGRNKNSTSMWSVNIKSQPKSSSPEEWFRITIFIPFIDH